MMGTSSSFMHELASIHIIYCLMASSSYLLCFIILLLYMNLRTVECASSLGNETDRVALLAIKNRITSDPLGALSSWNDSLHFCIWPGVTCSHRRQRAVTLDLSSLDLEGSMSPYIGNLSFLRRISFQKNNFGGEVPREISSLFRLQELNLKFNSFQGEILTNLISCLDLRVINFENNKFVGNIPLNLDSLSKLTYLWLNGNNFTGSIPPSLGNLSSLNTLSLTGNSLQGSIPNNLGRLSYLKLFQVSGNNLSREVPQSLFNISSINYFIVGYNQLHGTLPWNMGITLPNLIWFWAGNNKFSGPIPITLSNASKLEEFDVGLNNFMGPVRISLRDLESLTRLHLSQNQLGTRAANDLSFLTSLSNKSSLTVLNLNYNSFGGTFPIFIVNLTTNLKFLALGGNQLTGSIPSEVGNLASLTALGLESNSLTGMIPFSIGKLSKLEVLYLHSNKFIGEIPTSICNITQLSELYLHTNSLWGRIPENLGECRHLSVLDLSQNKLNGTIPKQVLGLSSLSRTLNLSKNSLMGSLPLEVGRLINLGTLDISENQLSGEIPSTLGNCIMLEYLYMNDNSFQGIIPSSLSTLRSIQKLDLSRNELSGLFPKYFNNFPLLQYLNLSFNDLEGDVPKEGIFKNASAISFLGNKKLCGGISELRLPNCPSNASKEGKGFFIVKVMVPTISVVSCFTVILMVLACYWKRDSKRKSSSGSSIKDQYMKVSYQELHEATTGFSSENLIGEGTYGSVYKGFLGGNKEIVAVKVLKLEKGGASKSFVAECKTLRNVRHRNLIKILTACSSLDFKGHDFKALIFEYMPNRDLEKWLHSKEDGQNHLQNLSFIQRLSIAIEVASALEYLHHHCQMPIAHCDLKPSNILLDKDMIAHVGDFGLSKLLAETSYSFSHDKSSPIAVKGSIGYVPPEYGLGGQVSTHGDVYSYGIILLEMFFGRRPTDDMFKDGFGLHEFAKMALSTQLIEIVDPRLPLGEGVLNNVDGNYNRRARILECLVAIIKVGIACSSESPRERMEMIDVVKRLQVVKGMFIGLNPL